MSDRIAAILDELRENAHAYTMVYSSPVLRLFEEYDRLSQELEEVKAQRNAAIETAGQRTMDVLATETALRSALATIVRMREDLAHADACSAKAEAIAWHNRICSVMARTSKARDYLAQSEPNHEGYRPVSEMVERVARAMKDRNNPSHPNWRGHIANEHELALIAIAAMREPTEAMLHVGEEKLDFDGGFTDSATAYNRRCLDRAWKRMIDEALK